MAVTENTILPRVKGLLVLEHEVDEVYFYTNPSMIKDGLYIELSESESNEEDFKYQTWINVKSITSDDAIAYTIYNGDSLQDIQSYRIIKDILELYETFPLVIFLKTIRCMSGTSYSASMQSVAEHRLNVLRELKTEFDMVKRLVSQEDESYTKISSLHTLWHQLDDACGSLDNAFMSIAMMEDNIPSDVKEAVDSIDFSAIVTLKNRIEELMMKEIGDEE